MRAVRPFLNRWLGSASQGMAAKKTWFIRKAQTPRRGTIGCQRRSRARSRVCPPMTECNLQGPGREGEHAYCGGDYCVKSVSDMIH